MPTTAVRGSSEYKYKFKSERGTYNERDSLHYSRSHINT
jgi:hypothetical protein